MRDINRIDPFLNKLGEYWKKVPDWRFGQLIENLFYDCNMFFIEDDEIIKYIEYYLKEEK